MDTIAMRIYLEDVIGLADEEPPYQDAKRNAAMEEGLETLSDFAEFDDSSIKILCASVRKPGGLIDDPMNEDGKVPNPGHSIPAICEERMKQAAYAAKIYQSIERPITALALSRTRLRLFKEHREIVDGHEAPEKLPVVLKTFGIMKAMDLIPIHLRDRLGVRKVSLAYVIRDDEEGPLVEPLEINRITSEGYESLMDELIERTPLSGSSYMEDNAKVYSILSDLVAGTSFESSLKAFQRLRNGRGAYLALCKHNLGSAKWDKIIEEAESYLLRREWNGKNYRYSLKSHINKHREAHSDLEKASQVVPYQLPDDHMRVGRLIKSITSRDPSVLASITHILGTITMRNDFEDAADFILLNYSSTGPTGSTHRISVAKNDRKRYQSVGTGKTGVEFRYHTAKEFKALTSEQIDELREWRKNRKENKQSVAMLQSRFDTVVQQNEEMNSKISALTTQAQNQEKSRNPLESSLNQRNHRKLSPLHESGRGLHNHRPMGINAVFAQSIVQRIALARQQEDGVQVAIELDSHADSPVAGACSMIIYRTGRNITVSGFTDELGAPMKVEVVHAMVIYECQYTGNIYRMVMYNVLDIPSIKSCLLHPIMMRLANIKVDECPKFLATNPSIENHSIYFKDDDLRIPLTLDGVISCIPCRKPTQSEVMDEGICMLKLTPNIDQWDPHDSKFQQQEESMLDYKGHHY